MDGCKGTKTFKMSTPDGHVIHIEESGNPMGLPVLYLHGGPGASIGHHYQWPFVGTDYRIIAFDQRGCGHSQPFASLKNNTLPNLIKDIEQIRQLFGVEKFILFGGSWGSTLALIYAIKFPQHVQAMILRGVFLGRAQDAEWFISPNGGAAQVFQQEYKAFVGHYTSTCSAELCQQFYNDLTSKQETKRAEAAQRWFNWEGRICKLEGDIEAASNYASPQQMYTLALFECHYLLNHCFIEQNYILENAHLITHIPLHIVHGRYDMVCKAESAFVLHEKLEQSTIEIIENAGHSMIEKGTSRALIAALHKMADFLKQA